ncbi:MAG TPA: hypothetical protein VMU02_06600 [bacterium]|nr:hypothetical protein [bacterium]
MSLLDRISNLDRRIVFLAVAVAVLVPLLIPIGFPVDISAPVQKVYDAIQSLPPGSVVLMSIDYDPSGTPELYPATLSVMRHCFARNLRVLVLGMWPTGVPLAQRALQTVAVDEYHKVYGKDFVNFGFRPGGGVMLVSLGRNIPDVCRQDVYGTPVANLEMMKDIRSAKDINFVITFSMGDPGSDQWIFYYQARYHGGLATAQTAIGAPKYYQYLQTGQLVGLIGGMKGAAEYEKLVKMPGLATIGMDSQSIAHMLIIGFIALGNVIYWFEKKRKK